MPDENDNVGTVRAYLAAIEAGDAAAVEALLHPEVEQTEYPNRLTPKRRVRRREEMIADLRRGAALLQSQSYETATILAAGARVAVEARWRGVLAVAVGRLQPGEAMAAHIAMVFELRDGRIHRQRNYDCFEDFSAA